MESLDIHLDARYLPGQSDVLADLLSHRDQVIGTERSLHLQVAKALLRTWGSPSLDLFTTSLDAKLPLYCSPGGLRGCVSPSLGQPGRLRVSTLSSSRKGGGSSQKDPQFLHDSGRRPSPSADPSTSHSALVGPAVVSVPLQPVPPRHPRAEPSRVATLQCILQKSGFSRGSAIEMSGCIRTSTSHLSQAKWMLFCGWYHGRDIAPVNATIPLIVDFLVQLRRDKGYRSARNSVSAL